MTWTTEFLQILQDESFHDVYLVGNDGIEVPCSKVFLAARSKVFKRMFSGEFQEKKDGARVPMDYPSVVLKILVKYCYTDELDFDDFLESAALSDTEATILVQLRSAAYYLEFESVYLNVTNYIGQCIFHDNEMECACAVLAELTRRLENEGPFWDVLVKLICQNPTRCLLPTQFQENKEGTKVDQGLEDTQGSLIANKGAMACPPRLLYHLLEKVEDKLVVVTCLIQWSNMTDAAKTDDKETQQAFFDMVKSIDLKLLTPLELSRIEPCSLFPIEQLYSAYVYHACNHACKSRPITASWRLERCMVVTGAGVECLNGCYFPMGQYRTPNGVKARYWERQNEKYGDMNCSFQIRPDFNEKRIASWQIVIKNSGKELHMYKGNDYEAAPSFSLWHCIDGKSPAPIVAPMKLKVKNVHAEN